MFQLPLEQLFTKYQIFYMQGVASGIPKKMLSEAVGNNTTRVRNNLFERFGFKIKDRVPVPVVMVMLSPFHKIQVFSGDEALPFLSALYQRTGTIPPSKKNYKAVTKKLVNIANFKDPEIPQFKRDPYPFWNNGPTVIFRQVFDLEDSDTLINFQPLAVAVKRAKKV